MTIATSQSSPRAKRPGGGLRDIIENRLETPIFFVVTVMNVIRAAQIFSGGALVMSALLGRWYPAFEIFTGLGLGFGSEMLMTVSGRAEQYWRRAETEIQTQAAMSKIARSAAIADARRQAKQSHLFMLLGAASSVYTGLSFLLTNTRLTSLTAFEANLGSVGSDLITSAIITALVFYLGVLKDKRNDDATALALEHLQEGMSAALDAAIDRFKAARHTDQDVAFIAEHLPANLAAKFRRATAKRNATRFWRASEIRAAMGLDETPKVIRDFNRQVHQLAKRPESGLEKAEDGRTWLIPHALVMEVWGEAIVAHRVRQSQQHGAGAVGVGQSAAMGSALPTPAPAHDRIDADTTALRLVPA